MARSIHETRRDLDRESEPSRRASIAEQLGRKRSLKKASRNARRPRVESTGVDVRWTNARFPADRGDVLGILSVLRPGSTDGLARVELHPRPAELLDRTATIREPREAFEIRDGGTVIRLFAWDWGDDDRFVSILRPYLRARALESLVHAVAQAIVVRGDAARGAISADRDRESLRLRQGEWAERAVVRWLRHSARDEIRALETWTRERTGIRLPFSRLIIGDALESLVDDLHAGNAAEQGRASFARSLHYAGDDLPALAVLRTIPQSISGRHVAACIALCRRRPRDAERISRAILDEDPVNRDALLDLMRACEDRSAWGEVLHAASRVVALHPAEWWAQFSRIRATIELGDHAGAANVLREIKWPGHWTTRFAGHHVYMMIREERFELAFERAQVVLARRSHRSLWDCVVETAAAHAGAVLGRPSIELPPMTRHFLESHRYHAWLRALDRDFPDLVPPRVERARPRRRRPYRAR